MYWHDGGGGWGPGAWVAMALMMVVFWGAAVALIVYAVRAGHHPTSATPPANDAARILDERFARGEIDADEYQHRRELLRLK